MSLNKQNPTLSVTQKQVAGEMVVGVIECCGANKDSELLRNIFRLYGFNYNTPSLDFSYEKYLQITQYLGKFAYPRLNEEEALERLGYELTHFYFRSPSGQILKKMAAVLGANRGAKIFVQSLAKRFPWANHQIEELRSHYVRYRVTGMSGTGAMTRGSAKASLEIAGGKVKKATTTILGQEDWVLEVEWY